MDRLSELPDEVLIRILSFMPTLDAVRTMLLSRFGELWALVPKLEFQSFNSKLKFMIFVRNVLILHQAPIIHTFALKFGSPYNYEFFPEGDEDVVLNDTCRYKEFRWEDKNVMKELRMFIKCGLKKQPKIVYIHAGAKDRYFPLPPFLFTNQSIEYLCLFGCELYQSRRVQMGSLRSLVLYDVDTDGKSFNGMMLGWPSLEKLRIGTNGYFDMFFTHERIPKYIFLHHADGDGFAMACPNAKILNVYFHSPLCFQHADFSSVCEANIRFNKYRQVWDQEADMIMEFLEHLKNAETVTFEGLALKDKTFPINRWKVVTLKETFCGVPCVVWICDLLRNSPYLEELTLNAKDGFKYFEWKGNQISPELSSPCVASHLSKVFIYIREQCDRQSLLQMVELFLKSVVELAELVIYFKGEKRLTSQKIHDLLRKFSRFTRASSKAVITIYWEGYLGSSSEASSSEGLSTFRLSLMGKNVLC